MYYDTPGVVGLTPACVPRHGGTPVRVHCATDLTMIRNNAAEFDVTVKIVPLTTTSQPKATVILPQDQAPANRQHLLQHAQRTRGQVVDAHTILFSMPLMPDWVASVHVGVALNEQRFEFAAVAGSVMRLYHAPRMAALSPTFLPVDDHIVMSLRLGGMPGGFEYRCVYTAVLLMMVFSS